MSGSSDVKRTTRSIGYQLAGDFRSQRIMNSFSGKANAVGAKMLTDHTSSGENRAIILMETRSVHAPYPIYTSKHFKTKQPTTRCAIQPFQTFKVPPMPRLCTRQRKLRSSRQPPEAASSHRLHPNSAESRETINRPQFVQSRTVISCKTFGETSILQ